jgi:uncharacterized protein (TIGR00369 family)
LADRPARGIFDGAMTSFQPRDPDFDRRVRASFARQAAMATLGAALERVAPGEVDLTVAFRPELTQQHGFLHAGVVTAVVDSACGYAALSLMEPGAAVLSVEFKVQLLAPARGVRFRARGRVVRAGRTLTVVAGELRAFEREDAAGDGAAGDGAAGDGALVALLTGTMMTVRDRPELRD